MKSRILAVIFCCVLLMTIIYKAEAWGFWAHKRINRIAVFTLPEKMIGFYKSNIDYITENAVKPDKLRYVDKNEAPRHYIDIDYYGVYPFDSMPRKWDEAVSKYSEDTLKAYGIVPWHIQVVYYRLVKAFKEHQSNDIIKQSTYLGHYIADACVPLHAAVNYNGQMTAQHGIHALWESKIPEQFGENYNYFVGKAVYIDNPLEYAWQLVLGSAAQVDSVLSLEKQLSLETPDDQKYTYARKGNATVKVYSSEYISAYNKLLQNMVERRMQAAIKAVGSFWLSAWIDAGQPDLKNIYISKQSESEKKQADEEEKLYKKGKWLGRSED